MKRISFFCERKKENTVKDGENVAFRTKNHIHMPNEQ